MTNTTSRRFLLLLLRHRVRRLAGARIEIVVGPRPAWTTANAEGAFSFTSGTFDHTTQVRAALDGYVTATQTLNRCATCANSNLLCLFQSGTSRSARQYCG